METEIGARPTLKGSPRIDQRATARKPKLDKVSRFIAERQPKTPFLVVDLGLITSNYQALRRALPVADVYYAIKANPSPEVIRLLASLGSSFDVASPAEVELALASGAKASHLSFGNTIKKERDIAWAFERGIRLFAFDSESELLKLSRSAPGSKVFCRLLTTGEGADWPLSRKFGCERDMAHELLLKARGLGLEPYGVSFHVGSQQTRMDQWAVALESAAKLFSSLNRHGITLGMVNIGGGLPARYQGKVASVEVYGATISEALRTHFGAELPRIITEPGRSLVGDAGTLEAEVVLISKKSRDDTVRWVYLDIGKFGGLAETHDEAIKYRIEAVGRKGSCGPVILAGPSCDSVDILYEKFQYQLPLSLRVGDRLRLHATGAYTASYASVGFNGFDPLQTYCI